MTDSGRVRRLVACYVLGALLTGFVGAPAGAADDPGTRKKAVDAEIQNLSEDLSGTSAQLQTAMNELAAAQGQLPQAQAELAEAQTRRAEAARVDAALAVRLTAAKGAEANQITLINDTNTAIEATRTDIGRTAANTYRGGPMSSTMALAFSSSDPSAMVDRYMLANTAMRSQTDAGNRLRQQQATMSNAQARLTAVRKEVDDLKKQAADNLVKAQKAESDAAARKAVVDGLIAKQTKATSDLTARKAEIEANLAKQRSEQQSLAAELKRIAAEEAARRPKNTGGGGSDPAPPRGTGRLSKPINGPITSSYGMRYHPILHYSRLHAGTDFGGGCGTPIHAAADGTVVKAGYGGGLGNLTVINHGGGLATGYGHQSSIVVSVGQRVTRGQVIGYEGTTGLSTGCHLHFEVYVNGDTVDPMNYL